ncbi:hypothetical protein EPA93_05685 [Ktedonosporobacter rubrisoli]|uniref:non-specific serine/threonine protein kinase n=1 Tax=Ktedonosporobacter rubrisoli TaxID=2509675 RepID=A0A4V0YYA3_KTERU|nr:protein kinase [Ktedonosporobacter rubrisoli]QBD75521.1 hypothetical protein EPA93_05685 [Ktedonosporobacter rubrisoli]
MLLAGTQLGHYRIACLIGRGGMGEVYLVEDTRIKRQVAIKVIHSFVEEMASDKALENDIRLFLREMKIVAALDHPHILPLYDFGEEILQERKLLYMIMPYRPEGSLATWLARRKNSPWSRPRRLPIL